MPNTLCATEAVAKIGKGLLSSVELVTACLARIEDTDGQIKAWAHLDKDYALAEAEKMDAIRRAGKPVGSLHGVPVGLKDIIDTMDFPTEYGSPVYADRKPDKDATLVSRLKEAGAIILGKTVTTELAFMHPAETRNPHNLAHSPGGSSSGSAAAVAAFQVPLAVGTQTNGSVIRPASYCGTYAIKPTRGVISRSGLLRTSKSLDQVGVFGRSLEDIALLADAIAGYDPEDDLSFARPRPKMREGVQQEVPVDPAFAWFELPFAGRLSEASKQGMEEILFELGSKAERIASPPAFEHLVEVQRIIHQYEFVRHLETTLQEHGEKMSTTLKPIVASGLKISDEQYSEALGVKTLSEEYFEKFFRDYDAVITPGATDEAPLFEEGTGDPVFSSIWTVAGLPSITLPLLVGSKGLPVGVQLIGGIEQDDRLLRTARWMISDFQTSTSKREE